MLHYRYFESKQVAEQFRTKVSRLGWTCSTLWDHGNGQWSVCTNYPF